MRALGSDVLRLRRRPSGVSLVGDVFHITRALGNVSTAVKCSIVAGLARGVRSVFSLFGANGVGIGASRVSLIFGYLSGLRRLISSLHSSGRLRRDRVASL